MISPIISEGVNEATPKQRTPEEPKQRTAEEDYKLVMALAAEWLSKQKSSTEDADLTLEAFIKKFTDNNPHAPVPEKVREFYKLKDGATSIKDIPIDVLPASPMKNIVSWICGIIAIVPPLVIGLNMNCDVDQSEYTLENKTTLWGVFIPGIIWIIVSACIHGGVLREMAGRDGIEEKSKDTKIDTACKNNLTNTGIVGALLFTVVIAMLQADAPQENTHRFLSRWYQIFLLAGLVASFVSIAQASTLLLYAEPLDNHAAALFARHMIDYFGEPIPCILMTILNSIYALVLWIFGKFLSPPIADCRCLVFFSHFAMAAYLPPIIPWDL